MKSETILLLGKLIKPGLEEKDEDKNREFIGYEIKERNHIKKNQFNKFLGANQTLIIQIETNNTRIKSNSNINTSQIFDAIQTNMYLIVEREKSHNP